MRLGDVVGRVVEIRRRHTSLRTNDGDTVIVPNSQLMRGQVTLLGRGGDLANFRSRRQVSFHVDFRSPPPAVIQVVEAALRAAPPAHVASEPPPDCVLVDIAESHARYAARYWLDDPRHDGVADSAVRTRAYYALVRAGMRLSVPSSAVLLTEASATRDEEKLRADLDRRRRALGLIDLFAHLPPSDLDELAQRMKPAPFCRGEMVHHEDQPAHWLYVLVEGTVKTSVSRDGVAQEVMTLHAPDIFGELSLLTGASRLTTVVAATDVECYRLEKAAFERILKEPAVAERVANVLADRKLLLEAARARLDESAHVPDRGEARRSVLAELRAFFGRGEGRAGQPTRAPEVTAAQLGLAASSAASPSVVVGCAPFAPFAPSAGAAAPLLPFFPSAVA